MSVTTSLRLMFVARLLKIDLVEQRIGFGIEIHLSHKIDLGETVIIHGENVLAHMSCQLF